jgi:hypothetical protein
MTAATLHRCLIAVLSEPERPYRRLTADEVTKLKAERGSGHVSRRELPLRVEAV